MMDLTQAYTLVAQFEGLRLRSYRDSVGVWTIGYGTTQGIHEGMEIDRAEATKLMERDVVSRALNLTPWLMAPYNHNELSAMLSLTYNIGLAGFHHSTLLHYFNLDLKREAADEFSKWIYAAGRISVGLVNRRRVERELFLTKV